MYYETLNAILEADYRYTTTDGTCQDGKVPNFAAKSTVQVSVTVDSISEMKAALALTPLTDSIDAAK